MDKESLKKNQFWYLLGGFALVWLVLWVCALVSASSDASKNRDELGKLKKTVADQSAKKPKNDKFIKPCERLPRRVHQAKSDKVWVHGLGGTRRQAFLRPGRKQTPATPKIRLRLQPVDALRGGHQGFAVAGARSLCGGLQQQGKEPIRGSQRISRTRHLRRTGHRIRLDHVPDDGQRRHRHWAWAAVLKAEAAPLRGGGPGRGNEMPGGSTDPVTG